MKSLTIRLVLVAAFGLSVAACATGGPDKPGDKPAANSLQHFPLTAHEEADETRLAVHPGGLSANQQAALAETASRWRDAGGEMLTIGVPDRGAPDPAASAQAEQTRVVLIQSGVDPRAIRIGGYDPGADPAAPIVASFRSLAADVPECGKHWDNLTATKANENQSNFGCAIAANMAAQIANPADIVGPQAMTASDAGRRTTVIQNYRKGLATGGTIDPNGSGAVSKAIP